MSSNPYEPPRAGYGPDTLMRPTRSGLTAVIESFLDGSSTAFEFDERLDEFRDSNDPVIRFVVNTVWYHYDDCDDHLVCLSKPEWNLYQRLLLLLASDCQIETTTKRIWSVRQPIAAVTFCVFAYFALHVGWETHLLLLAIPFGFVSMLLAYFSRKPSTQSDPFQQIIFPFATMSDLESAYHSSTFRKTRYPKHLANRTIRSEFMEGVSQLQTHIAWLLFSPLPLLCQSFPQLDSQIKARAVNNNSNLIGDSARI